METVLSDGRFSTDGDKRDVQESRAKDREKRHLHGAKFNAVNTIHSSGRTGHPSSEGIVQGNFYLSKVIAAARHARYGRR